MSLVRWVPIAPKQAQFVAPQEYFAAVPHAAVLHGVPDRIAAAAEGCNTFHLTACWHVFGARTATDQCFAV